MIPRERIVGLLERPEQTLVLAPMATLTHAGMRVLVESFGGCDLYLSEMISAEALTGGTQYESWYTMGDPDPARLILQLVGYSTERLVEAARLLRDSGVAGLDVNMGCSAPHIVRKGGGVAWMADAGRAAGLIRELRAVAPELSLSVKLRLGSTDDPNHLAAFGRAIEDAGADFVTLHPKRRKEGSARRARWSFVRMLREELSIPVVGNGGVSGMESLESRVREGGTGPVMVGRAAARAPWIFAYLRRRLAGGAGEDTVDLLETGEQFLELLERYQPRDFWPTRARRFLPCLASNLAFGHSFAARLAQTRSYDEVRGAFRGYFVGHPGSRTYQERG